MHSAYIVLQQSETSFPLTIMRLRHFTSLNFDYLIFGIHVCFSLLFSLSLLAFCQNTFFYEFPLFPPVFLLFCTGAHISTGIRFGSYFGRTIRKVPG